MSIITGGKTGLLLFLRGGLDKLIRRCLYSQEQDTDEDLFS